MAYDQDLAERIRRALTRHEVDVREVTMFGGADLDFWITVALDHNRTLTDATGG